MENDNGSLIPSSEGSKPIGLRPPKRKNINFYLPALLAAAAVIYFFLPQIKRLLGLKVDDWVYNPNNFSSDFFSRAQVESLWFLVVLFLAFLAIGIVFLIVGRKLKNSPGAGRIKKIIGSILHFLGRVNVFGYLALFFFLLCGVITVIVVLILKNEYLLLACPVLVLILGIFLLVIGIKRARKKDQPILKKKAIWPLFVGSELLLLLLVILGSFSFISNNLLSSGYSSGPSLSAGGSFGGSGTMNLGMATGLGASTANPVAKMMQNFGSTKQVSYSAQPAMMSENIGFSTGGAKDINNFRENIKQGYLPLPTDITYEGLFYDYYFETGASEVCEKLFCPSYSYTISQDPFSKQDEYYLSVGLNSGIKEADFQRKKLNLVVVLDISGSMGSDFNSYYYDQFGNQQTNKDAGEEAGKSKLKIAAESVAGLLDNLQPGDRFGMVLFDDDAYLAKPLGLVEDTDLASIKNHVLELRERGGTNMPAGIKMGTELFNEYLNSNKDEYENRIIFLTDAQPNRGDTSEGGLFGQANSNAEVGIYSTFIGIGVDFNTQLVEIMTKIKGANYYSIHSSSEFKKRLVDEFEFMVTPLVFDLSLKLDAVGYEIEKVYGSPEADEATGEIMKVNTLFPSKVEDGQTRGGLVLLKLKKISPAAELKLIASYKDRNGKNDSDQKIIPMPEVKESFPNAGLRKGVLLARYANVIRDWIIDERSSVNTDFSVSVEDGITVLKEKDISLGKWERQSLPLKVSRHYGEVFSAFKDYFAAESQAIGDKELNKEVAVMEELIKVADKSEIPVVSASTTPNVLE